MRPNTSGVTPRRIPPHLRFATLLGLSLATAACPGGSAQEPSDAAQEPVSVRTTALAYESIARPIIATGTLRPKAEIALSFTIGGVVAGIEVDAGARVREGETLASLDLVEIDAALAKARSAAEKAERDVERLRRLYADSVAMLSELQDGETAAEVARADLRTAEFNRRHAVIVAPSDGVILERRAEAGETVSSGAPVLSLGSRARGTVVRVGLADRDVVRVAVGAPATVSFDPLPGRELAGRVSEIGASAEPGTGTYAVEVALADADELPAGLVGRVSITPRSGAPTAVVPIEAVLEADGDGAIVYALSADGLRAERRSVTLALLDGARVAVADGLEGVSEIVTDGAAWLEDGATVRVVQ
ncbi:MAG TPA: efflux RND transporter periplasmic adaptor subunit [Longimicrobiales bacterium]|nr:efflux RND transporter periplasmic adaptor subunit [Longimicrobiales bacterium]